jgi:hypothetical protein
MGRSSVLDPDPPDTDSGILLIRDPDPSFDESGSNPNPDQDQCFGTKMPYILPNP